MNSVTGQHPPLSEALSSAMPLSSYSAYAPLALYSETTLEPCEDALVDEGAYTLSLSGREASNIPSDTQRILDTVKIAMSFAAAPPRLRK